MDSFDLGRLTDHDFEVVCRDLFGELLGVPLELFPRGRDRGIDLRHTDAAGASTVVQCKHWPRGDQNGLIRRLVREELPKVAQLRPDRYVIATTVGLTVDGKERLRDAFAPFVRSTGDIHGVDEIVAELRGRPELVRRHFRLWLSSTTVLRTVLHQERHLRSSWLRKRLPRVAETFVPHEGFERAKLVLDEQRVCVVAGIPGVGKTTVALMLSAWLMGNGYELHEVSQDIDEVGGLWLDDTPQVFLYDDFLGQTTLESQLNKNEDSRLLAVVRQIRETPGKALVLTTRDYILEHARLRHDRLAAPDVTEALSVIRLNDLGPRIRGQILYNHVHNSAVPAVQKHRFADRAVWQPVVTHRNFNPRLIEETLRLAARREQDVPAAVLANLDDPQRIWERIVEHELTDEAVHLLEVLFLLGDAELNAVRAAWSGYRQKHGRDSDGRLFRRAVQILDGTMLAVNGRTVAFHNPSIADYLRFHLSAGRGDISALLTVANHADQLRRLVAASRLADGRGITEALKAAPIELANAVRNTLGTIPGPRSRLDDGAQTRAGHLQWILETAESLNSALLAAIVGEQLDDSLVRGSEEWMLLSLVVALHHSPLTPRTCAHAFGTKVAESLRHNLADYLEGEFTELAITCYQHLVDLPCGLADARDDELLERLVELALEELHRIAVDSEAIGDVWRGIAVNELLAFVSDHCPGIDEVEDYPVVEAMMTRLLSTHQARQASTTRRDPATWTMCSFGDPEREHAVIAALMDNLRRSD